MKSPFRAKKDGKWLQQYLPFTVLKPSNAIKAYFLKSLDVATALTVYGIETPLNSLNSEKSFRKLQQPLPFTVCAAGCRTAEEQSDDEGRTSQVPERSEGKTKVIK